MVLAGAERQAWWDQQKELFQKLYVDGEAAEAALTGGPTKSRFWRLLKGVREVMLGLVYPRCMELREKDDEASSRGLLYVA